jgi:hypothetical protein
MVYVILFIVGLIIGGVGMYFILKNNPKWIRLNDLPQLVKEKVEEALKK